MTLQLLDDWDDERGCLSTTRTRHSNDIEALQNDGNGSALDRRGQAIALLHDCFVDRWRQIVGLKATARLLLHISTVAFEIFAHFTCY